MSWTILVLNFVEMLAAVIGFAVYTRLANRYYRFFPWYLLAVFLTEVVAEFIAWKLHLPALNNAIYRYWGIPLQFFFFYWLFYQTFKHSNLKPWPVLAGILYLLILLTDLFQLADKPLRFTIFSYCSGGILLLILIIMYFISLMKSDQILKYSRSFMFWISLGLLLFYLLTLPFYGLRNFLYKNYTDLFTVYNYFTLVLNYLMYTCFIIALLCQKKN